MHDPTPIEDPGHPYRLLVVANETLAAGTESVREVVARSPDGRRLEVLVVAPALWGRLERRTSDDRPRRAAEQRLRGYLALLAARGIRAEGVVGDDDPLLAINDALQMFDADDVLVATAPDTQSDRLALDVVARVRQRCTTRVRHVVVVGVASRGAIAA